MLTIVRSVALQSDGKIVAAGAQLAIGNVTIDFALARYDPDGTLDTGFGTGDGKVTTPILSGNGDACFTPCAIQPDGKIVAGGCQ